MILKEQRQKFARSHKVTEHGRVEERMMYHGSSLENINKIVTEGFCLDAEPEDRERRKLMLFGRGVYLSPLPGVRDGSFNLPHTLPFTPPPTQAISGLKFVFRGHHVALKSLKKAPKKFPKNHQKGLFWKNPLPLLNGSVQTS